MCRITLPMLLLITIFGLGYSLGFTQEEPKPPAKTINLGSTLTLQDCIAYALEYHFSLIVARQELVKAEAKLTQTKSNYYPQLNVNSQNSYSGTPKFAIIQGRLTQAKETYQTNLGLNQTIYETGRKETVSQAAQQNIIAEGNLKKAEQNLAFEVTQNYYAVLRAQHLVNVAEEALQQAKEHLKMAEERVAAGVAAPVDTLPAEVEVANAELSLIQARNQVKLAKATLKNSMGLDPLQEITIEEALTHPEVEFNLQKCLEDAYARRPELTTMAATVYANQLAVKLNEIRQGPIFTVDSSYNRQLYTSLTRQPDYYTIAATISMPLLDGGNLKAATEEAKANLTATKAQATQLKQDIALEVEQAYLNLEEANERIQATAKSVERARASLSAAEERYKEGVAIMLEVIEARVALTDAETNNVQALYDYNIALARLNKVTGKELINRRSQYES